MGLAEQIQAIGRQAASDAHTRALLTEYSTLLQRQATPRPGDAERVWELAAGLSMRVDDVLADIVAVDAWQEVCRQLSALEGTPGAELAAGVLRESVRHTQAAYGRALYVTLAADADGPATPAIANDLN